MTSAVFEASVDVAIVGFGPTGATLANLLGAYGLTVAVFDREPHPPNLPRAVHFDGEVMRIFQAMGLADALRSHVRPSSGMQYLDVAGRLMMERKPAATFGKHGWAENYLFHQPDLEAVLRAGVARFPNIRVFLGHNIEEVSNSLTGASLVVRDLNSDQTSLWRAGWVIGCDGGRSLVRQSVGSGLDDLGLHQPWLVVDVVLKRDVDLPESTVQFCDPSRPTTFVKVTGQRRRWEIMIMPDDDITSIGRPEVVWSLLSRWVSSDDATLVRSAIYTFHSLIARRWRHERLIIAGDAAHQTPPFLGQGMCTGIRDAANLAWKLAFTIGGAPESILDTYQSERLPHALGFIEAAVQLGNIIQTTDPAVAAARDAAFHAGGPEEIVNMSPPLGPGLHDGRGVAGTILPQPTLGDGRLLDSVLGSNFAVIGRDDVLRECSQELRQRFDSVDAVWIGDPGLYDWLEEAGAPIVVLRPDRYVLGTAEDFEAIERLATLLPAAAEQGRQSRTA